MASRLRPGGDDSDYSCLTISLQRTICVIWSVLERGTIFEEGFGFFHETRGQEAGRVWDAW